MINKNSMLVKHQNDFRSFLNDSHTQNQPRIDFQSYHVRDGSLYYGDKVIGDVIAKLIAETVHDNKLYYLMTVRCRRSGFKAILSISAKVFKSPCRLAQRLESLSVLDVAAFPRMRAHLQRAIVALSVRGKGRGGAR